MARGFYNLPRKLTDTRRFNKDGKIALAAYLGIKLTNVNSYHHGITIKELKAFFHIGYNKAARLRRIMSEDKELFTINERKNCVFANSCKDKEIKAVYRRRQDFEYIGDDVIKVPIPECLKGENKQNISLRELILLIERALIIKEYDGGLSYKSSADKKGKPKSCVKEEPKSQVYVSKSTGINRTTLIRRLNEYVEEGYLEKIGERHLERCNPNDPNAFEALNKRTRLPYWLRCTPVTYAVKDCGFTYTFIIWNAAKRIRSEFVKSDETIKKEINASFGDKLSPEELEFKLMVRRQFEMLDRWS